MDALESYQTITAARQQEIDCLHNRGIDSVSDDGFITDGWNQRHPDQSAQAKLDFADRIEPVVDARAQVRSAYRDFSSVTTPTQFTDSRAHSTITSMLFTTRTSRWSSLDSLPSDTFNDGCITVTNPENGKPSLTDEQIRSATGITTHGVSFVGGTVNVCDNPGIGSRPRICRVGTARRGDRNDGRAVHPRRHHRRASSGT